MYDKNLIINYIKQNAYKKYIDKKIIQEEFNCSEKTSERILKSINYNHMKQSSINMMKDIEIGIPSPELIIKYDCTLVNLNSFIKRHKITKVYDYRLNNYSDINYFNKINTSKKAYILGFIAADGCVTNKEIKISLHSKDTEILEKFIFEIGLKNKEVKHYSVKNSFNQRLTPISTLSFGVKEMITDLQNLGFDNRKTVSLKFPDIEEQYYLDFIRGYCDGDGSFTRDKNNKYTFSLEGTELFLNFIKEYLSLTYNVKFNTKLYKRYDTENCCYTLKASGKNNVIKILDLLYKNSNLYLERKYNKYLNITKL